MLIHVKLYASLRRFRPDLGLGQSFTCDVPAGTSVEALSAEVLRLPKEEVAIVLVNGLHCPADHVLAEGDAVALWPPIAGGAAPSTAVRGTPVSAPTARSPLVRMG